MIPLALIPGAWKLGALAAVVVALGGAHLYRVHQADATGYKRAVSERAAADLVGVVGRVRENEADLIKFTVRNDVITKAKNEELVPVVQRIYVDRVRVGPAICNGPAAPAAPEGAGSSDGADPPGRLVPQQVEDDIRALTADVEKHLATGRACQRFNTDNGLVP